MFIERALQPALQRLMRRTAQRRPELFRRMGAHKHKRFLIDPLNTPFVFVLKPDPGEPSLRMLPRRKKVSCDARIAGSFLTLFDMIDGRLDGDALFFTRDLTIEGDTEAVVVLRNALDDLDGRITDDIAAAVGFPARTVLKVLRRARQGAGYAAP